MATQSSSIKSGVELTPEEAAKANRSAIIVLIAVLALTVGFVWLADQTAKKEAPAADPLAGIDLEALGASMPSESTPPPTVP